MRRLTLHRESLTDLTADELSGVAGAAQTQVCPTHVGTFCYVCNVFSETVC